MDSNSNKRPLRNRHIFGIFVIVLMLCLIAGQADTLDYPHNPQANNYNCDQCHLISGSNPSLLVDVDSYSSGLDDTTYNNLCWGCHNDVDAVDVETHSYLQIDDDYGEWSVECRTCHNPHTQRQVKIYTTATYLATGTLTGVDIDTPSGNQTTLTDTTKSWTDDEFIGLSVIPDTGKRRLGYKILDNTDTTLVVDKNVDETYIATGDTYAIVYGKLIRETIATDDVLVNSPTTKGVGDKTVRLYTNTGTNSFADGDTTYDGVCEVCHTQTLYHRNDATGDHTHYIGVNCADCHTHASGFKPSCSECHGYPPTLNTAGGPNGLASYLGTTGSVTAGAHDAHVNTKGYTCSVCHYNSDGLGSTHLSSLTATLGFYLFSGAYQGGSYDGQSGVSYDATTTSPVTTVTNTGTNTCSSIYCHSTGQSTTDGSSATPAYVSPVWSTPSSGACGTCHKVTEASGLNSGSHDEHLGTTGVDGCADCHTGAANDASSYSASNHVNSVIDVANTYTAGGAPGNGYGTCSTASCHDDGTGTPVVTPTWGTTATICTSCHAAAPTTGSHNKHLSTTNYNTADCADCHDGAVKSVTAPEQHLDDNIDVYDSASGDLGYTENKTKGTAYASCSTAYCHSTGQSTTDGSSSTPTYATVTWGSTAACGTCHKVTEASGLTSGSHAEHLGSTGVTGCADCHTGAANNASAYDSVNHVDSLIEVANSYSAAGALGNGYGTCAVALCHDDGTGSIVITPVWGSSPAGCSACHDAEPSTGSHTKHLSTTNYNKAVCADCHDGAVKSTTAPAQHLDDNIDVYDSASGDLGYTANKTKGTAFASCSTAYCHSTGQSTSDGSSSTPTYATVTWGSTAACGTCHKVTEVSGLTSGSHGDHLGSSGVDGCSNCHTGAADNASSYDSTSHVNASIDVANTYTAGGTPGNSYGTCSTAVCHGSGTDTWGTDLSAYNICTKCHGVKIASPTEAQKAPGGFGVDTNGDSAATDAQVGAHQAHMTLPSGITNQLNSGGNCNECHKVPSVAGDAGHIDSALPAEVYPGTINPQKADLNSVAPAYSSGICTVYCHGASLPGGSTNGADTTPAWIDTGYLTGVAANDCAQCHGYPPLSLGVHSGKVPTDCITCHDSGVNAAGTGFTDASAHINGIVNLADDCFDCHSSKGGPTPGTTPDVAHGKHIQTAYVGTVSGGDYGNYSTNSWYGYSNTGGVPDKKCGYCHPQSSATHMDGTVDLNFDPADPGAAGTMKAKNHATQTYSQVQRTSVTCSSTYCHSSGYNDGSGYEYTTSPEWYAGSFVGDKCDDCHGNMPDTSSHFAHIRGGIHYDTIYNGTSGLLSASGASGAGHGDLSTSTTINCNLCHNETVTVSYNDQNSVCNVCHSANSKGTMVIDPSATTHVTGTSDVVFADVTIRTKAQIRDDITTVTELNTYWQRNNGYKAGATSHDSSKATLGSTASFSNGTCSTVVCHNGVSITWDTNISSCRVCHTDVPLTNQ